MAKQYIIKDEANLRKRINREYLIRLTFPKDRVFTVKAILALLPCF